MCVWSIRRRPNSHKHTLTANCVTYVRVTYTNTTKLQTMRYWHLKPVAINLTFLS